MLRAVPVDNAHLQKKLVTQNKVRRQGVYPCFILFFGGHTPGSALELLLAALRNYSWWAWGIVRSFSYPLCYCSNLVVRVLNDGRSGAWDP